MITDNKIELRDAINTPYDVLGRNLGAVALLLGGWIAIGVIVLVVTQIVLEAAMRELPDFAAIYLSWPEKGRLLLSMVPLAAVSSIGTASIVVAWHRFIIVGTAPRHPFAVNLRDALRYIGRVLLVFGGAFTPMILIAGGFTLAQNPELGQVNKGLMVLPLSVAGLVSVIVILRLSLVFPAVAVGDRTLTFARAWQLTSGNTWRLFWGTLACSLPFTLVQRICERSLGDPDFAESAPGLAVTMIGLDAEMVGYLNVAGFVSLAYLQLARGESAGSQPPASHFS